MNAIPQKKPGPRRDSTAASAPLIDALVSQAASRAALQQSAERIAGARARNANQCNFTWHSDDGREAEFCLYYLAGDDLDILAAELLQLDYREPATAQRLECEQQFTAELAAEGELWSQVESHLWERAQSSST